MIESTTSRQIFERIRLALLLLSPVLFVALVGIVASIRALADLGAITGTTTDAGLARLGGDLALVIVTERGPDIEATRSLLFNWGILVPIAAVIAGGLIAWWLAGRVRNTVDSATATFQKAEGERISRLEEIVHELRTPLAVVGANLELAQDEPGVAGRSAEYVAKARRAVGRMARTVDDLAGHGGLTVEKGDEAVDLARLAEAIVEDSAAHAARLGVAVATAPMLPSILVAGVDPDALRSAIGNFMTNATRLSPRGSEIRLDCGELDGWAWLAVMDEGPGLALHHHARVFERGWQGAHDRDRQQGSGLGLTIARQLTEAQGGLVTVESEEGDGATFTLWLPAYPGADPAAIVASDRIHPLVSPWARATSIA